MPTLTERRVRVADFGVLGADSPLLRVVPSVAGKTCRLHVLAAAALDRMAVACRADVGVVLLVASGHRAHRWKGWAEYERFCVRQYGSLVEGRKWVAFDSPHETGLAIDFGSGGLEPRSVTAAMQRKTVAYKWLAEHAHEYGFTPYLREPWHWEYWIPRAAWESGNFSGVSGN